MFFLALNKKKKKLRYLSQSKMNFTVNVIWLKNEKIKNKYLMPKFFLCSYLHF